MIIRLKPSFCASLILLSIWLTALISPDSPISPTIAVCESKTTSLTQVIIASAIPKSADGSETSIPPMTFTYTSCFDRFSPILFSNTASICKTLLRSTPLATLRGVG